MSSIRFTPEGKSEERKEPNVKKWKGEVLGSDLDIKTALLRLQAEPKNVKELQEMIFRIRREQVEATSKDSLKGPY